MEIPIFYENHGNQNENNNSQTQPTSYLVNSEIVNKKVTKYIDWYFRRNFCCWKIIVFFFF